MELLEILKSNIPNGGDKTQVTIKTLTEEKLNKKGNSLKDNKVTKLSETTLILNENYQEAVNEQLTKENKEANFESSTSWHKPLYEANGYLSCNKKDETKIYIKGIVEGDTKFINYFVDGELATEEQLKTIKEFKPKTTYSNNQGTEKQIQVRLYDLNSIVEVALNSEIIYKKEVTK
jgi:hypothetical protein